MKLSGILAEMALQFVFTDCGVFLGSALCFIKGMLIIQIENGHILCGWQ